MMSAWTRRWLPWLFQWAGAAILIVHGGILDRGRLLWGIVFSAVLIVSLMAGATPKRSWMTLLVAGMIVIGAARSLEYAQAGAWGPLGVWTLMVGAHLVMWAGLPVENVTSLDCQKAPTCPRRVMVSVRRGS